MTLDEPNRQSGLAHSYRKSKGKDITRQNPVHGNTYRRERGRGTPLTTTADENELVFA